MQNQETEFECVSMYTQSALQHPQMKNHQIQVFENHKQFFSGTNVNTVGASFTKYWFRKGFIKKLLE